MLTSYSKKSKIVDVRLGSKYAFEITTREQVLNIANFYSLINVSADAIAETIINIYFIMSYKGNRTSIYAEP